MKQNLRNFLFVLLVLVFAIIAKVERDNLQKASFQENIYDTSLTNSVGAPAVDLVKNRYAQNLALMEQSLSYSANSNIPQKKDGIEPLKPGASVVFAKDLNSGAELFSLNGYSRWPIASITKLMTAVIAIENVGPEKQILISEKAFSTEGIAGDLQVNESFKVKDLVKAMMAVSSNDAAVAIAEFYGEKQFVEAMREKAASLGMLQTAFVDPTGLSFLNQSTTYDLEKLIDYILKNHPEIFNITRQQQVSLLELERGEKKVLTNINFLAGRKDFLGGKTGFIDASGSNLVSIFNYEGRQILIIIFGTEDRFGQTELVYNWIKNAFEF